VDNDSVILFLEDLRGVIFKHQGTVSNVEALGCLRLLMDQVSDDVRGPGKDAHPLS
jgi:hypothetical protein